MPPAAGASSPERAGVDRKSTRLNSSHVSISYAVFCLKKKNGRFEDSGVTPRLTTALGATYRIGPGRAHAQVEFDWSPSRIAQYAGSTSSVQGMLGYLVNVR